jgi:hypothetical protein
MITIQGFKEHNAGVFIVFDTAGIDEMIDYLNFIKSNDASMHLNVGNELGDEIEVYPNDGEEMYIVPHLKIINIDKLEKE